jgi:prevent-host-death family protein
MYSTRGIDQVATITELRTNTNDLLRFANETDEGILIARNNEPQGVLVGVEQYQAFRAYVERQMDSSK